MKEISIKIDDELYCNASRKVGDLEAKVNQQVSEYLETLNSSDAAVVAARSYGRSFQRNQKLWRRRKTFARRNA